MSILPPSHADLMDRTASASSRHQHHQQEEQDADGSGADASTKMWTKVYDHDHDADSPSSRACVEQVMDIAKGSLRQTVTSAGFDGALLGRLLGGRQEIDLQVRPPP
jgi:hypothetical protein